MGNILCTRVGSSSTTNYLDVCRRVRGFGENPSPGKWREMVGNTSYVMDWRPLCTFPTEPTYTVANGVFPTPL